MTPKNFSALILNLYQDGHITYDDDMTLDLTNSAKDEIQECVYPNLIEDIDLEGTIAFMAIKRMEVEARHKADRSWAEKDAQQQREEIASVACSGWRLRSSTNAPSICVSARLVAEAISPLRAIEVLINRCPPSA